MDMGVNAGQSNQNPEGLSILQRMATDDKSAINECLDAYSKLIWSLCRDLSNNREDAEDAVQEIFIDIWKNAAKFDPQKSPERAFILLIARRRLIDRHRRNMRRPQILPAEYNLAEMASDSHKRLQLYVETLSVVAALNKLAAPEILVIEMSIYGGRSHSEISAQTGIPLGTVKNRIRRGLKKIQRSIGYCPG